MDRTDMGTGWEEEDAAEGKGERRGAGETWAAGGKVEVWATCLECCERAPGPGLCPVLVGCYSEQPHGWVQLEPGEAWAAASVHVLIDFLEQGVQQGFALRLL